MSRPPRRDRPSADPATLPDVRDGLTHVERVVLRTLAELQRERRGASVPTAMLYGRVVERVDLSVDELVAILRRLMAPPR